MSQDILPGLCYLCRKAYYMKKTTEQKLVDHLRIVNPIKVIYVVDNSDTASSLRKQLPSRNIVDTDLEEYTKIILERMSPTYSYSNAGVFIVFDEDIIDLDFERTPNAHASYLLVTKD